MQKIDALREDEWGEKVRKGVRKRRGKGGTMLEVDEEGRETFGCIPGTFISRREETDRREIKLSEGETDDV